MRNIMFALVMALLVSACGFKGPLYIPEKQYPQPKETQPQETQPQETQSKPQETP